MKIQDDKREKYQRYIEKNSQTMTGRMQIRFLHQWATAMEMEIEKGFSVDKCALKCFKEVQKIFEDSYNLKECINFLSDIWKFGNELKLWYSHGGHKKEIKNGYTVTDICISKHSRKRMHSRCGFNKKAQNKMAKTAFYYGIGVEQTDGVLRSYMANIIANTENSDDAIVKLYGDKVYLYQRRDNCNLLITVMNIPLKYQKIVNAT